MDRFLRDTIGAVGDALEGEAARGLADLSVSDRDSDDRYKLLWQCVITQAIDDAKTGKGRVQLEALDWLLMASPDRDFELVCELAGFEPYRLRAGLNELLGPVLRQAQLDRLNELRTITKSLAEKLDRAA